jgi:hypothetical protein
MLRIESVLVPDCYGKLVRVWLLRGDDPRDALFKALSFQALYNRCREMLGLEPYEIKISLLQVQEADKAR